MKRSHAIFLATRRASPPSSYLDRRHDEERLLLRQRFEAALQRDVDLVALNAAPTILAYQALKYGKVIAHPNLRAHHEFVMRLVTEYADFKRRVLRD
ncbi:nucleotidyltransferase domain-containing protein [Roseiflexus sp.]|uniref:nucleotidyltransferase domain-containing protein n=1 Tax=Roseiflexus sp. TaxID=2562120 RepID=UPI00398ACBC2